MVSCEQRGFRQRTSRGGCRRSSPRNRNGEALISQIRLYVDEDAAEHAIVKGLRDRGVDVLTVVEAGMDGASDHQQLAFATAQGRTIYTLNVGDFCRLHTESLAGGENHTGILVIPRQRYSIGEKIRRLSDHIDGVTAEEMCNRLEFL